MLKTMRKNLKKKLIVIVDKLGPELFEDFSKLRAVKRQKTQVTSQKSFTTQY